MLSSCNSSTPLVSDLVLETRLHALLLTANGAAQLARQLGVQTRAVTDWQRAGKISRIGALLVDRCPILSRLFSSRYLRPDLDDQTSRRLRQHQYYEDARIRQIDYQSKPEFAETSLYYLVIQRELMANG